MGATQERWLSDALGASVRSGTHCQLLAQQVVMGPTFLPRTASQWFAPSTSPDAERRRELEQSIGLAAAGIPFGLDRWDGYPGARARLLSAAQAARATLVTLSGVATWSWTLRRRPRGATGCSSPRSEPDRQRSSEQPPLRAPIRPTGSKEAD